MGPSRDDRPPAPGHLDDAKHACGLVRDVDDFARGSVQRRTAGYAEGWTVPHRGWDWNLLLQGLEGRDCWQLLPKRLFFTGTSEINAHADP